MRNNPFAYLTSEKAPLCRSIMRRFMESKERFVIHLRPEDIFDAVQETQDRSEIEAAVTQLCEWGNLQARPDTALVRTIEDFTKPRYTYRLTREGEAAERALALFDAASERAGELQWTALADIRHALLELVQFSRRAEPDAGQVRRTLVVLRARFDDLTAAARAFIDGLEQRTCLQASDARQWIDLGERFVAELVLAADSIGGSLRDIESARVDWFIPPEWHSYWQAFRNWFISQPGRPSNAEMLRERARTAIPALLDALAGMNDRRNQRIDRANDFRALARWFASAESDAEAHRLWRVVFGLCPARHLPIDGAALDDHPETARLSRIIDRTAEKQKLAAAARAEALRMLHAQRRFGTGRRLRLSELEHLEPAEFDLFLEVLGEAVSTRVFSSEPVEILTGDGRLRIKLEPTGDGREALILTTEGIFCGPDHWISIEPQVVEVGV